MVIDPQIQTLLNTLVAALMTAILAFVAAATPKLVAYVKLWLEHQVDLLRTKLSAEQLAVLDFVVTTVVREVEQTSVIGEISKVAENKKAEAIKRVQEECDRLGIPFDVDQAAGMIEAAINQGLQKPPAVLVAETLDPNIQRSA